MRWIPNKSGWFGRFPERPTYWITPELSVHQWSNHDFCWIQISACEQTLESAMLYAQQHSVTTDWIGAA